MAECKSCKKNIPEGTEFCDDCLDEKISKSNESYLDDLLNSMQNPSEESMEPDSGEKENLDENFILDEVEKIIEEGQDNYNNEEDYSDLVDDSLDDSDSEDEDNTDNLDNEVDNNKDDFEDEVDELAELLGQMNSDDPVAANIKEVSDLLSGKEVKSQEESPDLEETDDPVDVGDVFSDTLKVVNSLEDDDIDIPEGKDLSFIGLENVDDKKEKKQGFFARVFGNVKDEAAAAKEAEEAALQEEKSKEKKEQRKKRKAEKKELREKRKEEKKKLKEDKKKEKKEKKELKMKKAAMENLEEEEDEGKINRLGASIVFAFFGVLVIFILIGTNVFSYSLNIRKATANFEDNNYTDAYNEVYGVDINDSDIDLYDKIMTVMFVNKQLNSYNRYYAMGKYPEALDSLLKGLERYDKYIEFATIIGIESDLEYVKTQITYELDSVFNLSEVEAYGIIDSETQMEYSIRVYDVILENGNFDSL